MSQKSEGLIIYDLQTGEPPVPPIRHSTRLEKKARIAAVETVKSWNIKNVGGTFEAYIEGETLSAGQLQDRGYDFWSARNLADFFGDPTDEDVLSLE